MNLKVLLYATFNICMLCTEKFHHNWQVYIGVQNERNKVFFTSMEHIWNRLVKTLPSAYNWRLCLIISAPSVMPLAITWPRYLTVAIPHRWPYHWQQMMFKDYVYICASSLYFYILELFLELYIIACSLLYFSQAHSNSRSPVAEGDNSTRSAAYIKWLIIISPDKQPVLQQLNRYTHWTDKAIKYHPDAPRYSHERDPIGNCPIWHT